MLRSTGEEETCGIFIGRKEKFHLHIIFPCFFSRYYIIACLVFLAYLRIDKRKNLKDPEIVLEEALDKHIVLREEHRSVTSRFLRNFARPTN